MEVEIRTDHTNTPRKIRVLVAILMLQSRERIWTNVSF